MCYTQRRWFGVLIRQLLNEGDKKRALQAAEKCEEEMPAYNVSHDYGSGSMDIAMAFVENQKYDRADAILSALDKKATQYFNWYMQLGDFYFHGAVRDCYSLMTVVAQVSSTYAEMAQTEPKYQTKADELEHKLEKMYNAYANRCASLGIQI